MAQEKSKNIDVNVGVLALQGGFIEHISHLHQCAKIISEKDDNPYCFKITEARTVSEIEILDGIIIPGGETTAMSILMGKNDQELLKALQRFAIAKPVLGTCAGLIMIANNIKGQMEMGQLKIGGIDVTVCRNAYGAQLQSFEAPLTITDCDVSDSRSTPMVFIRAPSIESIDSNKVQVLATYKNVPVAVRQNNLIGLSFHSELTDNLTWHMYFLKTVINEKFLVK
ncbi:putative pyridoxal 5'-phosphate synthase subunit pdx2 [Pseudolycoriella hygida]|uniref:Pyridoxal 5'-phosphate synthase subunit pdx2 n=1 Tax=Pseudolycoriella hygida TaxID=35572 RepID=A0A9Q0S1V5_9DIPT|nr:putative pyridoxal 5'-phosphate synthase subunit pdx2 [Pseudolycoriella hygida]